MATKKQKREAALAKRERFLQTHAELGLAAQQRSRAEEKRRQDEMDERRREADLAMPQLSLMKILFVLEGRNELPHH
jgi:hypothetical protein